MYSLCAYELLRMNSPSTEPFCKLLVSAGRQTPSGSPPAGAWHASGLIFILRASRVGQGWKRSIPPRAFDESAPIVVAKVFSKNKRIFLNRTLCRSEHKFQFAPTVRKVTDTYIYVSRLDDVRKPRATIYVIYIAGLDSSRRLCRYEGRLIKTCTMLRRTRTSRC